MEDLDWIQLLLLRKTHPGHQPEELLSFLESGTSAKLIKIYMQTLTLTFARHKSIGQKYKCEFGIKFLRKGGDVGMFSLIFRGGSLVLGTRNILSPSLFEHKKRGIGVRVPVFGIFL